MLQGCLYLFVSFAVLLAMGTVTLNLLGPTKYEPCGQIFLSLVMGIVMFPTLFAIAVCKGRTVLVLNSLVLWLLYKSREPFSEKKKRDSASFFLWVEVLALLVFCYLLSVLGVGGVKIAGPPTLDYFFYAEVSRYISSTGFENFLGDRGFFVEGPPGCKPYHYGDLWLVAGLKKFAPGFSHVQAEVLVVYPILFCTTILGLICCGTRLNESFHRLRWIAVFFIFVAGIYLPDVLNPRPDALWFRFLAHPVSPFSQPKVALYSVFLVATAFLFLNGDRRTGLVLILFLVPLSVTALPPILGGVFIYCLLACSRSEKKVVLPACVSLGILVALFYVMNPGNPGHSLNDLQIGIPHASGVAKAWIQSGIFLLPHLLILVFFVSPKSPLRSYAFLVTSLALVGVGSWSLIYHVRDSAQIFWNISIPAVCTLICLGVLELSRRRRGLAIALGSAFVFMGIGGAGNYVYFRDKTKVSDRFLANATHLLRTVDDSVVRVGYIREFPDFYRESYFRFRTNNHDVAFELRALDDRLRFVSLSDASYPLSKNKQLATRQQQVLKKLPFLKFRHSQPLLQEEEALLAFISHHNILFLVAMNGSIVPECIKEFEIDREVDNVTGLVLLSLDLDRIRVRASGQKIK